VIHRLPIPTPFRVGRVNCYLIDDDPLTLVDVGPNWGVALVALEDGVRAAGRRLEDLERIVITHQHADHLGLVGIVADRSGAEVCALEAFAPVVGLVPFTTLDEAIAQANASPFGLAAGIFSRDIVRVMGAARRLRVGLLHVNDASSSRVDLMPFGGVKQSGYGREGPKYAMQEMTQERLVTFNLA